MSVALAPAAGTAPTALGSPILAAAPHRIGIVSLVVHDLGAVSRSSQEVLGLAVLERSDGVVRLGAGAAALLELVRTPAARARATDIDGSLGCCSGERRLGRRRRLDGEGTVAQQRHADEAHDPQRQILPATIGVGEEEAGGAMHGVDGAQ